MVEHLLGQCTALTEAMNRKHRNPFNRRKQNNQLQNGEITTCIHRLPQRRLGKYYEALQQLHGKIRRKLQANTAQTDIQRDMHKANSRDLLNASSKMFRSH